MLGWLFGKRQQKHGFAYDVCKAVAPPWLDDKWAYPPLEPKTLRIFGESVEFTAHKPDDPMCCWVEYRATVRGERVGFDVYNECRHMFIPADYERDIERRISA